MNKINSNQIDNSGTTTIPASGVIINGGDTTFQATSTNTYQSGSITTLDNESVISNQADETYGAGYEGVYQSGANTQHQSGSTTDFNAGATVDFTGATVTGLNISGVGSFLSDTTQSTFTTGGTVVKYSFVIPAGTVVNGSLIDARVQLGNWSLGAAQFGTIQLRVGATIVSDWTINTSAAINGVNGDIIVFSGIKIASGTHISSNNKAYTFNTSGSILGLANSAVVSNATVNWAIANTVDVVFVGVGTNWAVNSILSAQIRIL